MEFVFKNKDDKNPIQFRGSNVGAMIGENPEEIYSKRFEFGITVMPTKLE
jgi:hypothetical protein